MSARNLRRLKTTFTRLSLIKINWTDLSWVYNDYKLKIDDNAEAIVSTRSTVTKTILALWLRLYPRDGLRPLQKSNWGLANYGYWPLGRALDLPVSWDHTDGRLRSWTTVARNTSFFFKIYAPKLLFDVQVWDERSPDIVSSLERLGFMDAPFDAPKTFTDQPSPDIKILSTLKLSIKAWKAQKWSLSHILYCQHYPLGKSCIYLYQEKPLWRFTISRAAGFEGGDWDATTLCATGKQLESGRGSSCSLCNKQITICTVRI